MRNPSTIASMRAPNQGSRALPYTLGLGAASTVTWDAAQEMMSAGIEFLQSVFIDNSQNSSSLTLTSYIGDTAINIVAQPYSQGYYPLLIDVGAARFKAASSGGVNIPIAFLNVAMPYFTWGPVPGVTVTPSLTNIPVNFQPLAAGDNQIVAPVAGETIKVYRLLLTFGAATNIQFWSGASAGGTALSGLINMFAGGSIMLQASGIPWYTCGTDAEFNINSSAAVNMGGMLGYVQS